MNVAVVVAIAVFVAVAQALIVAVVVVLAVARKISFFIVMFFHLTFLTLRPYLPYLAASSSSRNCG